MADALPGAVAPIPAAVRAAHPTTTTPQGAAELPPLISERATRMLALVDMARALPLGDTPVPDDDESTDRDDKLSALLHCLTGELQALYLAARGDGRRGQAVPMPAAASDGQAVPADGTHALTEAVTQAMRADALTPVQMLRLVDRWLSSTSHSAGHPVRCCIGETLATYGSEAPTVRAADVTDLFREVAEAADGLTELLQEVVSGKDALMGAAIGTAGRIGWLADSAARAHGSAAHRGDAGAWMLSPRAAEALQAAEVATRAEGGAA